jgi:chromatin remodeling complex protein RSC6
MPATAQTTAKQPKTPKAAAKAAAKADATTKPAKPPKAAKATADAAPPAAVVDATKPAAAEKVAVIKGDDVEKSECLRLLGRVQAVMAELATLKKELGLLDKQIIKDNRASAKKSGKRAAAKGDRQPSGFVKPAKITPELAKFLGKSPDTMMARTEVTKEINAYIREHKLQDPSNGRVIVPDTKLNGLLNVAKGEQLTYFNLQRYMKVHFVPSAPKPTTA